MSNRPLLVATALASGMMIFNPAFAQDSSSQGEVKPAEPTANQDAGQAADAKQSNDVDIIALPEWDYDELYADGISVEDLIDAEVLGPTGEEIGDVENVIFDTDGKALSVIAEVGGFLDIGDTHVNVPWDQLKIAADGDSVTIPLTQETIEDYSLFADPVLGAKEAATEIEEVGGDNAGVVLTGPRAWRAAELIGDYARLKDGDAWVSYGYIDDLVVRDGQVAAVVVSPDTRWGVPGRYYAYPYYGYGYGWYPGLNYYDLPYDREETSSVEPFDEQKMKE
jgi:sporulation protein YlmC with PRC-barrel domain